MKAKELAKLLGVSPATVSLVLNNKPGISDSLRRHLVKEIEELGHGDMLSPSCREGEAPAAKGADKGRPVIAYLSYANCGHAEWQNYFFSGLLEGAEVEAREHDCGVVVLHMACAGRQTCRELLERSGNVIGVVAACDDDIGDDAVRELSALDVPAVFIDSYDVEQHVSSVNVDNLQAMTTIVKYLTEKGHREIGYVYSGWETGWQKHRRMMFVCALHDMGLKEKEEYLFRAGTGDDLCEFQRLAALFSQAEALPTALVCENDKQAMRAISALKQIGKRVPEDVSVVGFDNSFVATMTEPRLTTVENSANLMGRECVMLLQNLRRLKQVGVPSPCVKYTLPVSLVERDSVRDLRANS